MLGLPVNSGGFRPGIFAYIRHDLLHRFQVMCGECRVLVLGGETVWA